MDESNKARIVLAIVESIGGWAGRIWNDARHKIPLKPGHVDLLAKARADRWFGVEHALPAHVSLKRYRRLFGGDKRLVGLSRKDRRRTLYRWWKLCGKRRERPGIA